jgi:hypothetical protein
LRRLHLRIPLQLHFDGQPFMDQLDRFDGDFVALALKLGPSIL